MKLVLIASLLTNLILGYFLIMRKPQTEVVERLIIETHKRAPEKEIHVPPSSESLLPKEKKTQEKVSKEIITPDFTNLTSQELQDAGEKMESERLDFLSQELGLSEEKIARHNQIRDEFFQNSSKFWQKNPMREPTLEERRQMLELEEDLYRKLEALHGLENWQRYKKFRENYNLKGYQKQMEEGVPFIFMGL